MSSERIDGEILAGTAGTCKNDATLERTQEGVGAIKASQARKGVRQAARGAFAQGTGYRSRRERREVSHGAPDTRVASAVPLPILQRPG